MRVLSANARKPRVLFFVGFYPFIFAGQFMRNRILQSFVVCYFCTVAFDAGGAELTTVANNGDSGNRVDVVFIGDGYTADQIDTTYADHIDSAVNYFFGSKDPFPRYQKFFNLHRIDVISNESGADEPNHADGPINRDTALGASYGWGGSVDRLLYFNTGAANTQVNQAVAGTGVDVDMRIGVVNSSKYGGGGGQWAVYAGANGSAREIAVHEVGHSFARLADEYAYTVGTVHGGGEPSEVNVTADPAGGKWDRWLGYTDPDHPELGAIGYYEGARYFQEGLYRPTENSLMRSLGRPLDAIGREAFIAKIYDEVDPLDAWMDTGLTLSMSDDIWVDVIDEDVINVQWLVDGSDSGLTGSVLDIESLGLASGDYQLTARAYDSLLDSSFSGGSLDWWRSDTDSLTQTVSWQLTVVAVPEPSTWVAITLGACGFLRRRRQHPSFSKTTDRVAT